MQFNGSILIILVIICLLGINAIPVDEIRPIGPSPIILQPGWPILSLCGWMGTTCQNQTDCCPGYQCSYPGGYDGSSTRCCGTIGATGCTAIAGTNGKGCCPGNFCLVTNSIEKSTECWPILTKKRRAIQT